MESFSSVCGTSQAALVFATCGSPWSTAGSYTAANRVHAARYWQVDTVFTIELGAPAALRKQAHGAVSVHRRARHAT